MDLELNEEQRHLQDAARRFMANECTLETVRALEKDELGYSPGMWRQMADMGWLGLPLAPEYGGVGMGVVDLVVLTKELGRAICPSPYLSTVVLAAGVIEAAGTEEQKRHYLERIAAGQAIIGFAFQEGNKFYDPRGIGARGSVSGGDWVLNGAKMFVEYANSAERLLVVARTSGDESLAEGLTMFLVDPKAPGVALKTLPTMARDRQFRVDLSDVKVGPKDILGPVGGAWPILDPIIQRGLVAFCGYMLGCAEKMHQISTDYAKDRVQFGRPIGSFQLIQSYLSRLIMEIWGADTLTYYAAWSLDQKLPSGEAVAKAKAFVGDTVKRTTDIGSQIFGGIGYMEEMYNTPYLRRGKQFQLSMGDTGYWEDVVASHVLAR